MTQRNSRRNFRAALKADACISPASVYDPLSARIAESVGYKVGMLAGSVASFSTLAAPDLIITTLTEVADQVRRIMRACDLGLLIDADHGYGNALSVMRTIEELEHAGASAVSIEDTLLPQPFGPAGETEQVIPIPEMLGKLRAAMAGKSDPDFVVAGRTSSLRIEGLDGAVKRVKAYAEIGVDAIFAIGVSTVEEARALHEAAGLPLIIGPSPKGPLAHADVAKAGVRIMLQGHAPIAAAAKALRDAYAHLQAGGEPASLKDKIATTAEMDGWVRAKEFAAWRKQFLS